MPAAAFADPKAFGQNPAGNGPYKLAENGWQHNVQIQLVPNPDYSGPRKPANGGVDFKIYANTEAAYQDLLGNNLDVLDQIPPSSLKNFADELKGRSLNQPYAGNATLTISDYLPQFAGEAGKLRRQAISMSIDRQQIIDKIFFGNKKIATDFTSPVIDGFSDAIPGHEVLTFDAEKAKELWKQADALQAWDNSKPFTIAYNVDGAGNKEYVDAAVNQIKNTLGIAAEPKAYATFKELRAAASTRRK